MFDRAAAESLLQKYGAEQRTRSRWMLDDAVDIILDDDRWLARVYLNAAHPEYLDIVDQWGAEGDSLQTLEHFIRVWKEPVRLVPGSYGTPI